MSKKHDEGGDPRFKGATPETLARALLRPVDRPVQANTDDEIVFLRKPKPGKKRRGGRK